MYMYMYMYIHTSIGQIQVTCVCCVVMYFQNPILPFPYFHHFNLPFSCTFIIPFSRSQVGCTLDYWNEDQGVFTVLKKFHLSETTPTEVLVSEGVGSRRWRIVVSEVEWVDEEEGELFVSQ